GEIRPLGGVDPDHVVAVGEQSLGDVRSDEPRHAGDGDPHRPMPRNTRPADSNASIWPREKYMRPSTTTQSGATWARRSSRVRRRKSSWPARKATASAPASASSTLTDGVTPVRSLMTSPGTKGSKTRSLHPE